MHARNTLRSKVTKLTTIALAIALGGAPPLLATLITRTYTDEGLAREAGLILHGNVTEVHCAWNNDRTQIYTFVDVCPEEVLKGELAEGVLHLRLLGGTIDGLTMTIVDAPTFEPGEEVVLFLRNNPQMLFPVVGFYQGKLTVAPGANGEKRIAASDEPLPAYLGRIRALIETARTDLDSSNSSAQQNQKSGGKLP